MKEFRALVGLSGLCYLCIRGHRDGEAGLFYREKRMTPWEASELLTPELSAKLARSEARRRALVRNIFGASCVFVLGGFLAFTLWSRHQARQALTENGFKQIGLHYHNYHSMHGRGPSCLEDLESFVANEEVGTLIRPADELAFALIRGGRFVVVWDAVFDGEPLGERILGYESLARDKGGLVLLADGFVGYCTAEDIGGYPEIKSLDK